MPQWILNGGSRSQGIRADARTSRDADTAPAAGSQSGPARVSDRMLPANTVQLVNRAATWFSMMVVITSWAPVATLSQPGMAPHAPPAPMPAARARGRWIQTGRPSNCTPTQTAPTDPIRNCPAAPMLNRPALMARATDRPVRTNGEVLRTVAARPRAVPAEPATKPVKASHGLCPNTAISTAPISTAPNSANAACSAAMGQGCALGIDITFPRPYGSLQHYGFPLPKRGSPQGATPSQGTGYPMAVRITLFIGRIRFPVCPRRRQP